MLNGMMYASCGRNTMPVRGCPDQSNTSPEPRCDEINVSCEVSIYFWLTSPMTDHHSLLAPKAAPQPTCQKCRRHGDSVHRPVRSFSVVVQYGVESQLLRLGCLESSHLKLGLQRAVCFCVSAVANVVPIAETLPLVPGIIVLSRQACSGSLAHLVQAAGVGCPQRPGSRGMLCGVNRGPRVSRAICRKPIFLGERPR